MYLFYGGVSGSVVTSGASTEMFSCNFYIITLVDKIILGNQVRGHNWKKNGLRFLPFDLWLEGRVCGPEIKGKKWRSVTDIIIWLVPRAGKMNQITRCDWLPERARWSHLALSGLPAVSRKQNFTKSHIINPLLTKFVRSRRLDIGLVLFLRVYGPRLRLGP